MHEPAYSCQPQEALTTDTDTEQVHEEFVRCSLQEAVTQYGETATKVRLLFRMEGSFLLESHVSVVYVQA